MSRELNNILPHLGLATAVMFSAGGIYAQCYDKSPARPVPECVSSSTGLATSCTAGGAVRLWPTNFRPGGVTRGQSTTPNPLPQDRDTTDRIGGITIPGASSGHELFKSVDVVDNILYVAYNAGIQAWDIGTNPEFPARLHFRDGWLGHFLSFPPPSEQLTFIEDLAAIDPGSGQPDLIVVSGKSPVGVSIWKYTTGGFSQHYQDIGTDSSQVRIIKHNTVVYAFAATNAGIAVYNATAASNLATPCVGSQSIGCSGVYRGLLPNQAIGRYLDVMTLNGKVYTVSTDGNFVPLEIWELSDPNDPSSAIRRFDGTALGVQTRGPAFISWGGDHYLAFVQSNKIKIYDIDDCLDSNGCSALGACKTGGGPCEVQLSTWPASEQYLTVSDSSGTPFLYYGGTPLNIKGPKVEQLINVSDLGSSNPNLPEITSGAGTITDSCNGTTVDYWGYYYPKNAHGLRNFYPRIGKFKNGYFYRAAQATLDVHLRENVVVTPEITVAAQTSPDPDTGAYWFGENISFLATAANCTPANPWLWEQSSSLVVDGLGSTSNTAVLKWNYCNANPPPYCNDETVVVMAAPASGCGTNPDQVQVPNPFVLKDPRPQITALSNSPSGSTHPAGTELTFSATLKGKKPYTYAWRVTNPADVVVATGSAATLVWDQTCVAQDVFFSDGFESGNLTVWSDVCDGMSCTSGPSSLPKAGNRVRALSTKGAGTTFEVELQLTNGLSPAAISTTSVTLVPPGTLGFSNPAVTVTDLGGGSFDLHANSQNGTEWRWEIQDPNGSSAGCQVYSTCRFYDWGVQGQTVQNTWQQLGTFGVTVWTRNSCSPATLLSGSGQVVVTEVNTENLEVTSFKVDPTETVDCTFSFGFVDCHVNRQITFLVTFTGSPTSLKVDWNATGTYTTETVPTNGKIFHTYTATTGTFKPKIRAVKAAQESLDKLLNENLTIVN